MDYKRVIEDNIQTLLRCTHVNVYVIALLRAGDEGLTEVQESRLLAIKPLMDRCKTLYEWMKESAYMYRCFLEVMNENQQEHVANLLKGNLEGPHVPLSSERFHRLSKTKPKLMKIIHFSEVLVSSLESRKALSFTDGQDIRHGKSIPYEKNFMLIGAIQRRSDYSFQCFEEVLREEHQEPAADYLTEGLIIPVHVNTNRPEIETQLSDAVNEAASGSPSSDDSGIEELRKQGAHVVAATPDKSILIYIYCKTPDSVVSFTDIFNSGQFTKHLKDFFNHLIKRKLTTAGATENYELDISLSLDEEEVLLIEEYTGQYDWKPRKFPKIQPGCKIGAELSPAYCDGPLKNLTSIEAIKKHIKESVMKKIQELHWSYATTHPTVGKQKTITDLITKKIKREPTFEEYDAQIKVRKMEPQTKVISLDSYLGSIKPKTSLDAAKKSPDASKVYTVDREREKLLYTDNPAMPTGYILDLGKDNSVPTLIKTIRLNQSTHLPNKKAIGMAILKNDIYVMYEESSIMEIYDFKACNYKSNTIVNDMASPISIASCSLNNCLYVLNKHRSAVRLLKMHSSHASLHALVMWEGQGSGCCLSTCDGNIILSGFINGRHQIREFSCNGSPIHEVNLLPTMFQALKIYSERYICLEQTKREYFQKISIINGKGVTLKTIEISLDLPSWPWMLPNSAYALSSYFSHFLTADNKGNILVADVSSNKILSTDLNLKVSKELISKKHGLEKPHQIVIDDSGKRIFVLNAYGQSMQVFSINLDDKPRKTKSPEIIVLSSSDSDDIEK